jgi:hypoxanthine phosphoribosyltransferase
VAKYGFGPQTQEKTSGIDRLLFGSNWVQKRVAELGLEIFQDYADDQPVLVGVLKGVVCFMGDLIRQTPFPFPWSSYPSPTSATMEWMV